MILKVDFSGICYSNRKLTNTPVLFSLHKRSRLFHGVVLAGRRQHLGLKTKEEFELFLSILSTEFLKSLLSDKWLPALPFINVDGYKNFGITLRSAQSESCCHLRNFSVLLFVKPPHKDKNQERKNQSHPLLQGMCFYIILSKFIFMCFG